MSSTCWSSPSPAPFANAPLATRAIWSSMSQNFTPPTLPQDHLSVTRRTVASSLQGCATCGATRTSHTRTCAAPHSPSPPMVSTATMTHPRMTTRKWGRCSTGSSNSSNNSSNNSTSSSNNTTSTTSMKTTTCRVAQVQTQPLQSRYLPCRQRRRSCRHRQPALNRRFHHLATWPSSPPWPQRLHVRRGCALAIRSVMVVSEVICLCLRISVCSGHVLLACIVYLHCLLFAIAPRLHAFSDFRCLHILTRAHVHMHHCIP